MYSLDVIKTLNRSRQTMPEDPWSRQGSVLRSRGGIVLHSASKRSTGFLAGKRADRFMRSYSKARGTAARNNLIDSYVP